MLKKIFAVIGVIAVFGVIGSAMGDDTSTNDDTTFADEAVADLEEAAAEEADAKESADKESADKKPAKKAKPEPTFTSGQANAIAAAQGYLDFQAFSKSGLIKQLKFEDYKPKDAVFAANHIKVNWNKQAVASAKNYLDFQSFSKSGLIEQLEFEGYTHAQAVYGANRAY